MTVDDLRTVMADGADALDGLQNIVAPGSDPVDLAKDFGAMVKLVKAVQGMGQGSHIGGLAALLRKMEQRTLILRFIAKRI